MRRDLDTDLVATNSNYQKVRNAIPSVPNVILTSFDRFALSVRA